MYWFSPTVNSNRGGLRWAFVIAGLGGLALFGLGIPRLQGSGSNANATAIQQQPNFQLDDSPATSDAGHVIADLKCAR